jgi:hypothetical protein
MDDDQDDHDDDSSVCCSSLESSSSSDNETSCSSASEVAFLSPSSSSQSPPPGDCQIDSTITTSGVVVDDDDDDLYVRNVRRWVQRIPVGLGLCPWAVQSQHLGRIKYRTCLATTPCDVEDCINEEVRALVVSDDDLGDDNGDGAEDDDDDDDDKKKNQIGSRRRRRRRLMTTLVICPNIGVWKDDYDTFNSFVQNLQSQQHKSCHYYDQSGGCVSNNNQQQQEEDLTNNKHHHHNTTNIESNHHQVTFVAFHPLFLRWRGLPDGITVGSVVQSHRRFGLQKSQETMTATVIETGIDNAIISNEHTKTRRNTVPVFGLRRVKVRFHEDNREQYVPTDWVVVTIKDFTEGSEDDGDYNNGKNNDAPQAPALPDNAMHRAPYPTIHLIHNSDLGKLQARDVSRVKRKNAQRMMKIGWDGVELRLK